MKTEKRIAKAGETIVIVNDPDNLFGIGKTFVVSPEGHAEMTAYAGGFDAVNPGVYTTEGEGFVYDSEYEVIVGEETD